jgi:hypothetical protein
MMLQEQVLVEQLEKSKLQVLDITWDFHPIFILLDIRNKRE